MSNLSLRFSYTANVSGIIGKLPQGSSQFWKVTLSRYWKRRSGTVEDLANHIGKGFAWMPGLLKPGTNRGNSNIERLELLGSDIDNGVTIAQALELEFVKKYCALGVESSSSTQEKNKFRLIWILPESIEPELCRFVYNAITDELGASDPACKDEARFFYGAKDRVPFLLQGDRALPMWLIEKARAAYLQDIEAQEVQKERLERYQATRQSDEQSDEQIAVSCLEKINPADLDWYEWRNVLLAAHNSGLGEHEVRRWSVSCSKHSDKGFNDVWKHIKSNGKARSLGLGSLIHWAIKNGWEFPEEHRQAWIDAQEAKKAANPEAAKQEVDTWKEKRAEQLLKLWQARKVYTADVTFEAEYLSLRLFPVPEPNTIVAMNSGMGSNKTGIMKEHISIIKERDGCGFTLQGCRNTLLRQTVKKWGFEMLIDIEDDVDKETRKQAKELGVSVASTAQAKMSDPNSMLAFCIDSHVKWQPQYFDGKVLILDEADGVMLHALTSGTLRDTRKECLESFVESIKRASIIYCLSATLTDAVIDYIHDLRENETTTTIKYLNTFQKSVTIHFVAGESRDITDRDVIREMVLDEYEPCVIVADSQKELEAIDQSIKYRWAAQGKRSPIILRIDSKTVETKEVKALLENPEAEIERLKPDFILISPSANSGLDISLPQNDLLQKLYAVQGRFKRLYGLYFGVIDVDSFAQLLFRLRDTTTERFISCPDQVILSDEDRRSQLPAEMVRDLVDFQTELALLAFTGADKADLLEGFFEKIRAQADDRHFQELNQIQAARNHERSHLKACLIERLTSLGHECVTQVKAASRDASEAIGEAKGEIEFQESKAILEADDISLKTAMVYRSTSVKYEKTLQAEKAFLKDRLKGIEDTELWRADLIKFVRFDDRRFTKQVELRYLFNNPETAQLKAQDALERIGFLPDIKADLMCVTALKDIGIERLIQYQGDDLHNGHQLIVDICQKAGTKKNKVRLSKSQGKQTNLQFIGRLLQMIGYGAIKANHQKKGQTRTYKIVDSHQTDFNDRFGESSFDIFYGCVKTKFENYLNGRNEVDFLAKNLPEKLDQNVTSKNVESYTGYGENRSHLQDTCYKNKMLKVLPDFTGLDQQISPAIEEAVTTKISHGDQAEDFNFIQVHKIQPAYAWLATDTARVAQEARRAIAALASDSW